MEAGVWGVQNYRQKSLKIARYGEGRFFVLSIRLIRFGLFLWL